MFPKLYRAFFDSNHTHTRERLIKLAVYKDG
jgi:hypothetical protein